MSASKIAPCWLIQCWASVSFLYSRCRWISPTASSSHRLKAHTNFGSRGTVRALRPRLPPKDRNGVLCLREHSWLISMGDLDTECVEGLVRRRFIDFGKELSDDSSFYTRVTVESIPVIGRIPPRSSADQLQAARLSRSCAHPARGIA